MTFKQGPALPGWILELKEGCSRANKQTGRKSYLSMPGITCLRNVKLADAAFIGKYSRG